MSSASIVFSYSTDPLVLAVLKEFHVFPVDTAHGRLAPAIVVAANAIPTHAAPLVVPLPDGSAEIEVVPVNVDGYDGASRYLPVTGTPTPPSPPPVSTAQHVMMFGQTRYLTYEISPGCVDCQPVFPQGLDLLRLHDSQCSYFQINTAPDVYDWSILDAQLDSCDQHGVTQVLYAFSYTPEWAYRTDYVPEWPEPGVATPHSNYPPRLDEFEKFFRALLDHVRRPDGSYRIQYFESWNETNALGFWNGNYPNYDILMEQQQMLWRVIKEVAPSCLLTTPNVTNNFTSIDEALDTLLANGFQHYAHLISVHAYLPPGAPASDVGPMLDKVNAVLDKYNAHYPLWDTEWNWCGGYPDDGQIGMAQVPAWIKESLLIRMQKGVSCAIWFQWDSPSPNNCGYMLSDPVWKGKINEAGYAWIDFYNSIHPLPQVIDLAQV